MTISCGWVSARRVKFAEIGHGDGGADGLDLAALDIAGEDPLAAAPADIGLQQIDGEAAQHAALGIGADQRGGHLEVGQIDLPRSLSRPGWRRR